MLRVKYQSDLNKLKAEEKHMRLIEKHLEDQINRLKVEELALKSQLRIQENPSILKEPLPEKSEEDVNINAVPLDLGVSYMHNDDDDDEEEDEDEENEDTAEVSHLLDQLVHQQQQQEEEEEEEEEDEDDS